MCEEAHRLKIANKPLPEIIRQVGGLAVAQLEMRNAAIGFKPNSDNSSELGNTGIKDPKYPISSYGDDYDSCLKGLQALSVDKERAIEECSTQWKGTGNRGGMSWTTSQIKTSTPRVVSRGEGKRIYAASAKINSETKEYYSKISSSNAVRGSV